jgi:hypothetical protein
VVDKVALGQVFPRILWFSGLDPGSVHVGFVVDKVALGQVFPPNTLVFPCQFDFTVAPLLGKVKTKLIIFLFIFITGLHNKPLMLRCVRRICCGALQKKSISGTVWIFQIGTA